MIEAFLPAFAAAGRRSIDAFLQSRPEFHLLAKTAIALHLMPLERDDMRYGRTEDWYGYLLDSLCQRTSDDYRANQLSVITFNFDRSLERRIYLTLQASYGISGDDLRQLCCHVPIVHVHGQLGTPSWLEGGDGSRDYGSAPNVADVRRCAAEIKIVYDEIPAHTKQRVRDCFRVADQLRRSHGAAVSAATMYPSTSSCNANNRSLDADDIAGILFLYPARTGVPGQIKNLRITGS